MMQAQLIEVVLCVQIVVLVVLYKAVCRIQHHLSQRQIDAAQERPDVDHAAARGTPPQEEPGAAGPLPTVASLLTEKPAGDWKSLDENVALTQSELQARWSNPWARHDPPQKKDIACIPYPCAFDRCAASCAPGLVRRHSPN